MGKKSRQEELPIDIVYEILLRLRVKTLSRFRCVSKSWLSLISSPLFQQGHYRQSQKEPLLLITRFLTKNSLHLSTYNIKDGSTVNNFSKTIPDPPPILSVLGVRSCRGLVCLGCHRELSLLFNPSTEEMITLPPSRHTLNHFFGFGYVASTEEYKVFKFFRDQPVGQPYQCDVFIVGTTYWREAMSSLPVDIESYGSGNTTFVNGALHFLSFSYNDAKQTIFISALDVETEECKKIMLPKCYYDIAESKNKDLWEMSLIDLGVSLCLSLDFVEPSGLLELWLLKNYDNREWAKIDIDLSPVEASIHPLAIMEDETILMNVFWSEGNELLFYDPNRKAFTQKIGTCWSGNFYVESFFNL